MSTDRPATTDPAEVAPVHTGGNAEDCPACDGRTDLPYPWICPGKDLTASGREPAVRASEAPGGDDIPAPDVGAAQGGEGGSATESEPRPMRPEDVPGKVLAEALEAWTGYDGDPLNDCDPEDVETAATILAAAIPAVRAQVADEIAEPTMWADPMGHWTADQADAARAMKRHIIRRLEGDQ